MKKRFIAFGIFFIILQIAVAVSNITSGRMIVLLWFCNHIPLMIGSAFLFNNLDIVKAAINVGFLAQLIWTIDFLSRIFSGNHLIGFSEYVFDNLGWGFAVVPVIVHVLSVNLAFALTFKYKTRSLSLAYSFAYLVVLAIASFFISPVESNINDIFAISILGNLSFPGYSVLWPFLIFALIAVPAYYFQKLAFFLWHKKTA